MRAEIIDNKIYLEPENNTEVYAVDMFLKLHSDDILSEIVKSDPVIVMSGELPLWDYI